ncbi:MAG: hypothetical protein WC107_02030 [Patescibacteria group bacterium]
MDLVTALSSIGIAKDIISIIIKTVLPKVKIIPSKLTIEKGEDYAEPILTIQNKKQDMLYDIQFAVITKDVSGEVLPDLLQIIKVDDQERGQKLDLGQGLVFNNSLIVDNCEFKGKAFQVMTLRDLKPMECRRIFLRVKPSCQLNFNIAVLKISNKPSVLTTKEGEINIPCFPIKGMKTFGPSFLIEKK